MLSSLPPWLATVPVGTAEPCMTLTHMLSLELGRWRWVEGECKELCEISHVIYEAQDWTYNVFITWQHLY